MSDEDEIMISALQHYLFCKRQFALIHIEQLWAENYLTASGNLLHKHVDMPETKKRSGIRYAAGLRLYSKQFHLTGIADMVEFHQADSPADANGTQVAVKLDNSPAYWRPFPVEYKRGRPKEHRADEIQLCAQAICLEEMLKIRISEGALFYGQFRRRTRVIFTPELRNLTVQVIMEAVATLKSGITPPGIYSKSCEACSLLDICQPKITATGKSARIWLDKALEDSLK